MKTGFSYFRIKLQTMGAWDSGNFGNDTALDWVDEFANEPGLEILTDTIDSLLEETGYIDSIIGCEALAAIEVLAAKKGSPSEDFPGEDIDTNALEFEITGELIEKAKKAVSIIKTAENSELRELWAESDSYEEWQGVLDNLLARLG